MGDIRELWLVIAIIILGFALSLAAVSQLPFLHSLHPVILFALPFFGAGVFFITTIYTWAGLTKLLQIHRQKNNQPDISKKLESNAGVLDQRLLTTDEQENDFPQNSGGNDVE